MAQKKAQPKTQTARPAKPAAKPELIPIQQLIADEVGDMLMRGGATEDVDSILRAALANMERRVFGRLCKEEEREEKIAKAVRAQFGLHKAELVLSWKRNDQENTKASPAPKTAAERIRAVVIETLRRQFNKFIAEGTPEEHHLMSAILTDHESVTSGRDGFDELPLGQAFEYQINGSARVYIRVPYRMQEQVERYIEGLKVADAGNRKVA